MICCYNAARNDPYKESHHPRYTPLAKVDDAMIRAVGRSDLRKRADVAWLDPQGFERGEPGAEGSHDSQLQRRKLGRATDALLSQSDDAGGSASACARAPQRLMDHPLAGILGAGYQESSSPRRQRRRSGRVRPLGLGKAGPAASTGRRTRRRWRFAAEGMECATVHAGWGMEDDQQACSCEAMLNASTRHGVPLYVETHRATILQDIWRTVQFVKRFPEIRFNGDFSHWYTGLEMVYGGFEKNSSSFAPSWSG